MARSTVGYLDLISRSLKARGGTGSDYAISKALGVTPQAVSKYRHRVSCFDESIAPRVAQVLGVPVEQVLVDVSLERARTPDARAAWARLARRLAELAGVVSVVILAAVGTPGTAQAGGLDAVPGAGRAIHYAHILRRFLRWMWARADDLADAIT